MFDTIPQYFRYALGAAGIITALFLLGWVLSAAANHHWHAVVHSDQRTARRLLVAKWVLVPCYFGGVMAAIGLVPSATPLIMAVALVIGLSWVIVTIRIENRLA